MSGSSTFAAEVYEPLQRYLRRRAHADDAADALADTLLVVWRRLDDVPDDPLPWCYGAAPALPRQPAPG